MTEGERCIPYLYRGLIEVWGKSGEEALLDLARAWERGADHAETISTLRYLSVPEAKLPPFPIAVQYEMFYALNELVSLLGIACSETLTHGSPRPDHDIHVRFLDRYQAGEIDQGYRWHWSQKEAP